MFYLFQNCLYKWIFWTLLKAVLIQLQGQIFHAAGTMKPIHQTSANFTCSQNEWYIAAENSKNHLFRRYCGWKERYFLAHLDRRLSQFIILFHVDCFLFPPQLTPRIRPLWPNSSVLAPRLPWVVVLSVKQAVGDDSKPDFIFCAF